MREQLCNRQTISLKSQVVLKWIKVKPRSKLIAPHSFAEVIHKFIVKYSFNGVGVGTFEQILVTCTGSVKKTGIIHEQLCNCQPIILKSQEVVKWLKVES